MQKRWLEHFCKYRQICEFLGNEGKEKEEIKEYLMQELGLPEATARYQIDCRWKMESSSDASFAKSPLRGYPTAMQLFLLISGRSVHGF